MSSGATAGVEIVRVAERALLVRFRDADLGHAVARAHRLLSGLQRERISAGWQLAVGAGSVSIELPGATEPGQLEEQVRRARSAAETALAGLAEMGAMAPAPLEVQPARAIAVEFGGSAGSDLSSVARECRLAESEVVARLCAVDLVVAFIGFSPGFPYLIGLPRELELPRLSTPRARVPAGSVAIAGPFAGIYPSATPGGWRLLGTTAFPLFDPHARSPATLAPGDRIRFVAE